MYSDNSALFNSKILEKYATSGPRYTSYPTALEFKDSFTDRQFRKAALLAVNPDLAIYIHVPFCHSLCYYCGCNKVITRNRDKISKYVHYLRKEISLRAALFKNHQIVQIHFGGGTPGMLSLTEIKDILWGICNDYKVRCNPEISIEIDPRETSEAYIQGLAELGVNRISMGVQDTNPQVQIAINRVQDTDMVKRLCRVSRASGIGSVNLDLIYGLPFQNLATFEQTLEDVLAIDPQRISLFNYAHLPQKFPAQRKIKDQWLPTGEHKLALMRLAVMTLTRAGYVMIGIDHFAKPDDELALALKARRLGRNFQGYSSIQHADLLGFGVSAISSVCHIYSQNLKHTADYYRQLDEQQHAIERGLVQSEEDQLRGFVIRALMTNLYVSFSEVEELFEIDFKSHFAQELQTLSTFADDGLVSIQEKQILVHECARLLVRNICMVFDQYLPQHQTAQRFSKVL